MISYNKIILYIFSFLLFSACNPNSARKEFQIDHPEVSNDSIRFNLNDPSSFLEAEVIEGYSRAITEYMNAVYKDKPVPDTLFIGTQGSGFDFPDIELPGTIGKTNIRLLTFEESNRLHKDGKSYVFLNTIGWRKKDKAEFIIVTFFAGGKPQHNCHIYFTHTNNEYKLDSLNFEYQYTK